MDTQTPTQHPLREDPASQRLISPLQLYDPLLVLVKVKLRLNGWGDFTGMGILVVVSLLLTDLLTFLQLLSLFVSYLIVVGTYLSLPSTMGVHAIFLRGGVARERQFEGKWERSASGSHASMRKQL